MAMFRRSLSSIESGVIFQSLVWAGIAVAMVHFIHFVPRTPNLFVCVLAGLATPCALQVPGILMRSLDKKRLHQDFAAYRAGNISVVLIIGFITGIYIYSVFPRASQPRGEKNSTRQPAEAVQR
ncbi:MAG: hypothetical protein IPK32_18710 [Verrucomicrobiaceae bacterium]|nr:hypothetical protein [Verrucomicrobiaceae bacterium]